jgi:small subunit ribosomal protein S3
MSQTTHPYGFRLVTLRPWISRWVGRTKKEFRNNLRGDVLVREYLEKKLKSQMVSQVVIERDHSSMKISIHTSRPGLVIGRSGEGIANTRADILKFANKNKLDLPKDIKIDIVEVMNPDADAKIVSMQIAQDLEKRIQFKRAMKMAAEKVMQARGVKGVRISLSGRLGGADMSRREETKLGAIPLQFIRADVDYATSRANMTYGVIGIKVWINRGDSLELGPVDQSSQPQPRRHQ